MDVAIHEVMRFFKRLGWAWTVGVSVGAAVGSIALTAFIVVRWPQDQFKRDVPLPFLEHRHPIIRLAGLVAKNLVGYVVIALGIVMALPGVPGQGILTILIGLTLINFPGKRRLERKLIRRRAVFSSINKLRARFGHPALEVD